MLDLLLPRTTRVFARVIALGLEQSLRTIRASKRPVYQALHTPEELAEFARRARPDSPQQPQARWCANVIRAKANRYGIELSLSRPDGFEFEAGQFVTLVLDVDGRQVRRQYSIYTDPSNRQELGLAVRRVAGGLVSNYLADRLTEGETLRFDGPNGRFTLDACANHGPLVLIAGGVGLTPLLSIAQAAAPDRDVTLVVANRGLTSIPLRSQIDGIDSRPNVSVRHVLERASKSIDASTGRLDAANLDALISIDAESDFFVCGPEPMMAAVCDYLTERGVDPSRVHTERFAAARGPEPSGASNRTHAVRFTKSGRLVNIPEGQTILEGARAAGVELPFSCTMGGCAACKVRVDGDVHLPGPNCLTESEAAAGETLACIACPRSSLTIDA